MIMKGFLKFLVTIIIIAIVAGAVWYLFLLGSVDKEVDVWDKDNEQLKTKAELVSEIDATRAELDALSLPDPMDDVIGKGVLDKDVDDFLESFEQEEVYVQVYKVSNSKGDIKIIVVPAPDFLNNQVFYFDKDGKLLSYVSESNGVGGTVEYYFNNDNLLKEENKIDEKIEGFEFEDSTDILAKAKRVYEKYK